MRIRYLSYGISKTGGYRHEKCLFDAAVAHFRMVTDVESVLIRKPRLFKSFPAHIYMSLWSYFKSSADINIVTARLALPALMRNKNNKKQVWIVLHNYDEMDGKSSFLKKYYDILFKRLGNANHARFKVVSVSPFWLNYFKYSLALPKVYHFPNLFDSNIYKPFITTHKNNWVHLGQYSSKNDIGIFKLAGKLSKEGYYCFFSTLNPEESKTDQSDFDVLYFETYKEYLEHVSRACCTLALSSINEGWNRMAHESILLGTPVIGYANGGLGDLLKESNSVIVKNIDEAYTCITEALWVLPERSFTDKYELKYSPLYIESLCKD